MMQILAVLMSALRHDRRGASGIEYAILAAMVAVVLAGFFVGMQQSMSTMFGNVNTLLAKA